MKVLKSFNFQKKGERENFLMYAYNNKDIQNTFFVKIYTEKTDFFCGIRPMMVIKSQDKMGFNKMISELPVCDYSSGDEITEIEIDRINRMEILQPVKLKGVNDE